MNRKSNQSSSTSAPDVGGVLRRGMVVGGRYRIESLLGCGGMAEVYRAEDQESGTAVALKLLPAQRAAGTNLGKRFENEARLASRLDHASCIRTVDSGMCSFGAYMIMNLIKGPTLRALALAGAPLDSMRVAAIVRDILSALDCAHELGILHRDVKPENVMFEHPDGSGRAVLIDFGLARAFEGPGLTGAGTCVGSPSYIAPERLLSQPYDERADLYSLGVMMYELLTARRPFVGASTTALIAAHVEQTPLSPDRVHSGISPAIAALCMRAISRDPADRFSSAESMAQALDRAVQASQSVHSFAVRRSTPLSGLGPGEPLLCDERSTPLVLDLTETSQNRFRRLWTWLRYGSWRWPHDDAISTAGE